MPGSEHRPKCYDRGDRLDSYSEEDRSADQREAAAHDNRGAIELDASRGRSRVRHGRWTTGRCSRTFRTVIRTNSPGGADDDGSDFGLAAFSVVCLGAGPVLRGRPYGLRTGRAAGAVLPHEPIENGGRLQVTPTLPLNDCRA